MEGTVHQIGIMRLNAFKVANWEMITCEQFLQIPNAERIELLLNGKVRFYDSQGNLIKSSVAMKSLMKKD